MLRPARLFPPTFPLFSLQSFQATYWGWPLLGRRCRSGTIKYLAEYNSFFSLIDQQARAIVRREVTTDDKAWNKHNHRKTTLLWHFAL